MNQTVGTSGFFLDPYKMSGGRKSTVPAPSPKAVTYEQCVKIEGLPVGSVCTNIPGHKTGIAKIVVSAPKPAPAKKNAPPHSKKRSRKNRKTRKQRRS